MSEGAQPYPMGDFVFDGVTTAERRRERVDAIAAAPAELRAAVSRLSDAQLDTPYRPGGWTVRQVVHHVADSHINAYIRFRLALSETDPTIRPYDQDRWAELPDARTAAPELSLQLLDALHARWVTALRFCTGEEFERRLFHPEYGAWMTLDEVLAAYAWHGAHHVAQVTALRARMRWPST